LSRIHGRYGVAYVGVDAASLAPGDPLATASPMAFLSEWDVNFVMDTVDVSAMTDPTHIYVAGLPDCTGDFSGYFDTATAQTYVSATDALPRNFYLYPSTLAAQMSPPQYFFGQILPDFSVSGGVTAAVSIKSNWTAASPIKRYPVYGNPGT
jgi:hypothetical protein